MVWVWHDRLQSVTDDPRVTKEAVVVSLDALMQRFGPTVATVKRHRTWTPGRHVVLMLHEVMPVAETMQRIVEKDAAKARAGGQEAPSGPGKDSALDAKTLERPERRGYHSGGGPGRATSATVAVRLDQRLSGRRPSRTCGSVGCIGRQ